MAYHITCTFRSFNFEPNMNIQISFLMRTFFPSYKCLTYINVVDIYKWNGEKNWRFFLINITCKTIESLNQVKKESILFIDILFTLILKCIYVHFCQSFDCYWWHHGIACISICWCVCFFFIFSSYDLKWHIDTRCDTQHPPSPDMYLYRNSQSHSHIYA